MSLRTRLADRLFGREIAARVQEALKVVEDSSWRPLNQAPGTAPPWHETRVTLERLGALCQANPLAARLVGMTTDFVIGGGAVVSGDPWALDFWRHPLNRLDLRIYRWCDELSRAGELFLVLSRNPVSGMSYVREIPALLIDQIESDPNDLERELRYHQLTADTEGRWWTGREGDGEQVMLHYAINKPLGAARGVSDLAQVAPWLEHYELWLEDRVRINRYKGAYLWQVKIENALPGQLEAKRAQYTRVPAPGSLIVTDGHETWTAVQPQIHADDVAADGKAIRLMIAAGMGVPLHFLAEGDSATRATAREMGVATYRHFGQRQRFFAALLEDCLHLAAQRAGRGSIAAQVRFAPIPTAGEFTAEGAEDAERGEKGNGTRGQRGDTPL